MALQGIEAKLSEINMQIDTLLAEREVILKEWYTAFNTEKQNNIVCVDENIGSSHQLYLVNGTQKMHVCRLDDYDLEESISDFHKRINTSMQILNIANKRDFALPDYQKNLVYAKAIEIREKFRDNK